MVPGGVTYSTDSLPLARMSRRFLGWAIDYLLFSIPFTLVTLATSTSPEREVVGEAPLWATFGFVAASAIYETTLIATRGYTLGAWIVKVRIVRIDDGRVPGWSKAGIRALVPLASQAVPVIGLVLMTVVYLTAFVSPRRQGLHDRAAGTIVVAATR